MSAVGFDESQLAAVDCRRSACILAGAGSGKTHTLVEAVTGRLAARFSPENAADGRELPDILDILALTFTDKAAAELRQRLARAFVRRRRRAEEAALSEEADFWHSQAARLDRSDIGTIHSYALRLVRENALRLGLPAAPALDADESRLGRDLDDIFLDWLDEGRPELLALLKTYRPDIVKSVLALCAARLGSWGLSRLTAEPGPDAGEAAARLAALRELVRETADLVRGGAVRPDKSYHAPIVEALKGLEERLSPPPAELLAAPPGRLLPELRGLIRASGRWYSAQPLKDRLSDALADFEACLNQGLARPLLENLLTLIGQLPGRLDRAKARRGAINFDDILILARRLLAANPEVRRLEISRRRLIFIDEFQDTNRLQADLLAFLLLPPADETVYPEDFNLWARLDWAAVEPRFQAYGDLKQSIYRFRGAEVEIMAGFRRALEGGGGLVLALDRNYRSQAPLVDFFNALFPETLGAFFTGRDFQKNTRPALYGGPHVVRLHEAGRPAPSSALRAEAEARLLVRYLRGLFDGRSGVLVGGGEGRPPRPGDVAVLFRRSRYAPLFKAALLEAGWPARLGLGDNPFDLSEVRGLLAAFNFLSGQDRELNLAAALRSPLGPVSDAALLRLVWPSAGPARLAEYFGAGARVWPEDLPPDDRETLDELKEVLDGLSPLMGRLAPVEILERLVEERRLLPLAALEPDGEARARGLTSFLALSRAVGQSRGGSLFASPAEELASLGRNWRGRSSPDPRPEEDAVALLTVHAAKGLEFPVVVIAEADFTPRGPAQWAAVSGDGRLALSFRDASGRRAPTAGYLRLAAEEAGFEKMENSRLLYVAATRARDHLVFLGRPKEAPGPDGPAKSARPKPKAAAAPKSAPAATWLETLLNCRAAADLSAELVLEEGPEPADEPEAGGREPAAPPAAAAGAGPNLMAPMILTGRRLSVTALARLLGDFSSAQPEEPETAPARPGGGPAPAGALSPVEAGLLFHAVLEIINPLEPHPRALLAAEAVRLGLAPAEREAAALAAAVAAFLDGPLGRAWGEAQSAGRPVFREWPFQMRLDDPGSGRHIQVSGLIDLFFQTSGGGWIVDYKLSDPPPARLMAAYEYQVRLYALALAGAGFDDPLRAGLYFAGSGGPVIHEVDLAAGWKPGLWENFFKNFFKAFNPLACVDCLAGH